MVIKRVRDNEMVEIHSNPEKNWLVQDVIFMLKMLLMLYFLFNYDLSSIAPDSTGAKCQKFNIVGKDEIDNLSLAQFIAKVQNKELKYEMVDFHSQRPGMIFDMHLAEKMERMGWTPKSAYEQLEHTISGL